MFDITKITMWYQFSSMGNIKIKSYVVSLWSTQITQACNIQQSKFMISLHLMVLSIPSLGERMLMRQFWCQPHRWETAFGTLAVELYLVRWSVTLCICLTNGRRCVWGQLCRLRFFSNCAILSSCFNRVNDFSNV